MDISARDKLIYGRYRENKYKFGKMAFKGLSVQTLGELIAQGYVDVSSHLPGAPTIQEIYEFMQKYPVYKAHGYTENSAVMVIEGVERGSQNDTVEEFKDYIFLFRNAKHFDNTTMYCCFE